MSSITTPSGLRDHVKISDKEKPGWDTPLAIPFRALQDLPPILHRARGDCAFIARSESTLYAINVNEAGDLEFLSAPADNADHVRRHLLEFSTWPSEMSLRNALASLSKSLREVHPAEGEVVDIGDFVSFVRELPYRVALIAENATVEPTSLQWFAFDAIFEARGEGRDNWFVGLGEPVTIRRFGGLHGAHRNLICFAEGLPFPLDDLTPTYEVVFDDEGLNESGTPSCGIHPASLRVDGPRPNVVEEMKAYRDLTDDALEQLRRFATDERRWGVQW